LNKVFLWFVIVLSLIGLYMYKVLMTTKAGKYWLNDVSRQSFNYYDTRIAAYFNLIIDVFLIFDQYLFMFDVIRGVAFDISLI